MKEKFDQMFTTIELAIVHWIKPIFGYIFDCFGTTLSKSAMNFGNEVFNCFWGLCITFILPGLPKKIIQCRYYHFWYGHRISILACQLLSFYSTSITLKNQSFNITALTIDHQTKTFLTVTRCECSGFPATFWHALDATVLLVDITTQVKMYFILKNKFYSSFKRCLAFFTVRRSKRLQMLQKLNFITYAAFHSDNNVA